MKRLRRLLVRGTCRYREDFLSGNLTRVTIMLKSPEYPKSPKFPKFPKSLASPCVSCVSVSPGSEGQGVNGKLEKELKGLATRNACTSADDVPEKKRFELARDLAAVQKRIGRDLTLAEIK